MLEARCNIGKAQPPLKSVQEFGVRLIVPGKKAPAFRTGPPDLQHRRIGLKLHLGRDGLNQTAEAFALELSRTSALITEQKDCHISVISRLMRAGDIGVAAFDAVNDAILQQEFEHPIDRHRAPVPSRPCPCGCD